jgi:hypothetical protein
MLVLSLQRQPAIFGREAGAVSSLWKKTNLRPNPQFPQSREPLVNPGMEF